MLPEIRSERFRDKGLHILVVLQFCVLCYVAVSRKPQHVDIRYRLVQVNHASMLSWWWSLHELSNDSSLSIRHSISYGS